MLGWPCVSLRVVSNFSSVFSRLLKVCVCWELRMSYLGVGISLGNVPVSHSINVNVVDRRVRVAKLVLRCVIYGLGVLGRR